MKIKFKILSGFVLIILMLIIAGIMSIYEFSQLSESVGALIEDNYKTIEAAKIMLESVEREDSGILLLVSGEWKEGRKILKLADSTFYSAFDIAKNNITEQDEDKYIDRIDKSYRVFKSKWDAPMVSTDKENNISLYFSDLHTSFLAIKSDIESLMILNQDSMYEEATDLKEKAGRAIMPGIVAIIAALIFLVIFNFFISKYFVKPIEKLIRSIKHYDPKTQNFIPDISSQDELKELENEIRNLILRVQQK